MIKTLDEALEQNKVLVNEAYRVSNLYRQSQVELRELKEQLEKITMNTFMAPGSEDLLLNELKEAKMSNSKLFRELQQAQEALKEAYAKEQEANLKISAAQNLVKSKDDESSKLKSKLSRIQNENGSFKELDEMEAQIESKDVYIALLTDNMVALEEKLAESQKEVIKTQKERESLFDHIQKLSLKVQAKRSGASDGDDNLKQLLSQTQKNFQLSLSDNNQLSNLVASLQAQSKMIPTLEAKIKKLEAQLEERKDQQKFQQIQPIQTHQPASNESFMTQMMENMMKMQMEIQSLKMSQQ